MDKIKYQIFISSTYEDLKVERDQVIKAILEMGHIPVGMEMFSAADEEQWKIITRQIDDSDYYVVIVANRYGSMVNGISYTEKEFNYALKKKVPTLGFILDSKASWPVEYVDKGSKSQSKLEAFKGKIKKKPVNFWFNKDDLHAKCATAIGKAINTRPMPGWIRSTQASRPEITLELSRLSNENANLREEVAILKRSTDISGLKQGDDEVILNFIVKSKNTYEVKLSTTWKEIFIIVADRILDKQWEYEARSALNRPFVPKAVDQALIDAKYDGPPLTDQQKFQVGSPLSEEDFKLIRLQLMALKLIEVGRVRSKLEVMNTWTLTAKGKEEYALLKAQRFISK